MWNSQLPFVQPYYAVKCNPDPTLLHWLYKHNTSFDCASTREMSLVKTLFGKQHMGNHVLFANPCKTMSDITYAKNNAIPWVTADSIEEFVKMDQANYKPEVLLRIAVDDSNSACPFGAKFGLQYSEIENVAHEAKKIKIPITGLSFHIGSGSEDPYAFRKAVDLSKEIWRMLYKKNLVSTFKALDIGGGWSPEEALFKEQARNANEGLKYGDLPLKTIAEPGRFFAAPTHDLYVCVVGKKPRKDGGWRYTIDESIYGQFSCIPFDHAKPKIARLRLNPHEAQRRSTRAILFGRTCDSLDWIATSESMEELEVGDWLYIPNMGAYTTSTSTEFNGFPKPECIQIEDSPKPYEQIELTNLQFPLASMLSIPS